MVAKVYIPERRGSLQAEMVSAARGYGMVAYPLAPRLDALLAEIAAGNPVLVFQNLGLDWLPRWHYAVVIGYDLNEKNLVMRSGTTERRVTPLATFERTWSRAGYWAQVILPPGHLPATVEPLPYLNAVHALEASGEERLALNAYRVAAEEWPEDPSVLMAWGNAEYAAGYLRQAETAFHWVITLQPRTADAWNNLAYVLAARQCGREVRLAIECAMALAPGDKNIRDSARELLQQEVGQEGKCMPVQCPVRYERY